MSGELDDSIRTDLLALTALRQRVVKENDLVGRLFATIRQDAEPPPSYADLDKAVAELEKKVPGFYVWYFPGEKAYGLFPNTDYTPNTQDAPEDNDEEHTQ